MGRYSGRYPVNLHIEDDSPLAARPPVAKIARSGIVEIDKRFRGIATRYHKLDVV